MRPPCESSPSPTGPACGHVPKRRQWGQKGRDGPKPIPEGGASTTEGLRDTETHCHAAEPRTHRAAPRAPGTEGHPHPARSPPREMLRGGESRDRILGGTVPGYQLSLGNAENIPDLERRVHNLVNILNPLSGACSRTNNSPHSSWHPSSWASSPPPCPGELSGSLESGPQASFQSRLRRVRR